jgi:hypothetical protein
MYTENLIHWRNWNKWKAIPRSWTGRNDVVKMSILLKVIYRFNGVSTKIPVFTEMEKQSFNVYETTKNLEYPKQPWATRTNLQASHSPNSKHKVTATKTARNTEKTDPSVNGKE